MEIELDLKKLSDTLRLPADDTLLLPQNQEPELTVGADGASFPAFPTFRNPVLTSGLIVLGTSSTISRSFDPQAVPTFHIVLPASAEPKPATAFEKYKLLKKQMADSGIPLLSDEDLRREIHERKGMRSVRHD